MNSNDMIQIMSYQSTLPELILLCTDKFGDTRHFQEHPLIPLGRGQNFGWHEVL